MTPSASPRLSIVLATYNAAATLERCLRSVVAQDFRDWELVIADGGSTDATAAIVERYREHVGHWHSARDSGIYDAWNKALAHARGEYVCFLGADDAWHDTAALASVFAAIGAQPYDLVTARGVHVDAAGRQHHPFGRPWTHRGLMRKMGICHPGALHRRDLFERYGLFDTGYRICGDYDFLLRLPRGTRALHVDRVLVDVAEGGISRDRRWLMLRERYRAQARAPHVGTVRAALNLLDKLWRIPIAKALGIPN
jgi:glycosyltransferase involved in cell wall biosynthesis